MSQSWVKLISQKKKNTYYNEWIIQWLSRKKKKNPHKFGKLHQRIEIPLCQGNWRWDINELWQRVKWWALFKFLVNDVINFGPRRGWAWLAAAGDMRTLWNCCEPWRGVPHDVYVTFWPCTRIAHAAATALATPPPAAHTRPPGEPPLSQLWAHGQVKIGSMRK